MKKKITIILFAMLAALPISVNAEQKENFCVCVNNERQEQIEEQDKEDFFRKLFSGQKMDINSALAELVDEWITENSNACTGVEKPVIPNLPTAPQVPDTSEKPIIPDIPEVPEIPQMPENPDTPEVPETPEAAEKPNEGENSENTETAEISQYVKNVIRLVNAQRSKQGLSALSEDVSLDKIAQDRAYEIIKSFSHTRPNGQSCFTLLDEYGYKYSRAGENIAMGQQTPEEVVNAWMNSQGHRENILGDFTKIGVGCVSKGGKMYWTQMFAK